MSDSHDPEISIGEDVTFRGSPKRRPPVEISLGDERTLGDRLGDQDTVIDDIEIVDLEARYKVEGTLGQGGMGAVLLATDTRLGRKVAVKRILGEAARSKTAIMRFLTEAKAIAALNHPNIVQIYDYGRAKDGPFLIMEYVDGGSLLDRCREGALPLEDAVDLACQLCDGLAKAHDAGIVHRDIKPANVLLNKDGLPKLTDFGLAKAEASDHGMTMTGAVMGTPDFMPPEQRRDASEVDARSDLWSLAATVYQMVTGRSPKIIRFNDIPAALQDVLGKALEDLKDSRYQTARELRDALKTSVRAAAVAVPDVLEGKCPSCGVQNDSSRRFCRGCGGSLEAPCLSCDKPMPMWEEICGSCGAKQAPIVDERRLAMAVKQAEAEGLLGDFEFDRALGIATKLRDEAHPKLKHLAGWGASFLEQIEKSRTEQTRHAVEAMTEAGKHEAEYDYLSASFALEMVPDSLRAGVLAGMRESAGAMLDRVKKLQAEARRLEARIKERLAAKQLDELLPDVERMLTLRPDRDDLQKIRVQLLERQQKQAAARDKAIELAKASLQSHDYEGALAALSNVASAMVTPEVVTLREQAEGLIRKVKAVAAKIKEAMAAKRFDGLLSTVEQYLKLKPADAEVAQLRQSLVGREEKYAADVEARLKQAEQLEQSCRFDEAAKLLSAIPEARRTKSVAACLDRASRLGPMRQAAIGLLTNATAGGYATAIESSRMYETQLADAGMADQEFAALLSKAEATLAEEESTRQTLRRLRLGAMALATVVAVAAAGLWMRASARASALATALQTEAWDAALAIEPDNAAALVGRARRKLQLSPPDIEGAFSDLDRAGRSGGSADATAAVRVDAHAVRAREQARVGQLDAAMRDLAESDGGGGSPEVVAAAREAIAAGWLERARTASSKGDTAALKQAVTSAGNFGVEQPTVLTVWQDYGRARIAALDATGLALACSEGEKLGLSRDQQAAWWVEFAELASTTPAKEAALVRTAIDAAKAAGASDEFVAPLRGSALMVEASSFTKGGDMKSAAAKAIEAMVVDTVGPVATLLQPANRSLREAVVKDYRERFHVGVAGNDWDAVLRIATAALALEPTATDWMGEALATHPDGLAAVPAEVLGRLPVSMFASLPPAKLPTIRNSIGIELKLLPAGTFMMGQAGESSDETPHQVTLTKPFYIGVYEVTNAQWKQVMGNMPSDWKDEDRPVEQVSWVDAMEFCKKLSALPVEQKMGRVYRLPTEAEWEYACRAGSASAYSFGDKEALLGDFAWFSDNSGKATHPVGQKQPNAWGLYDMHGNVWEWCIDWYGDFPKGTVTDPQGLPLASGRVFRGGSCHSAAKSCRSANRDSNSPLFRYSNLGFRLALSLTGGGPPEAAVSSERRPGGLPAEPATAVNAAAGGAMKPRVQPLQPDLPETIKNSIGVTLKLIPAGTFVMGSATGDGDETPHQVTITQPFYLGVTEVTNTQWKQVMGKVPSKWKDDDHPVERVSWEDAVEFCKELSASPEEVKAGRLYRLPTEAEWEYACRAATDTEHSFGDNESLVGEYGWFSGNSGSQTHPVAKKKPNAWGLFDMYGNVWEWCCDWYGDYPKGAVTDPRGPPVASVRVFRGSCWYSPAKNCRSAIRNRSTSSSSDDIMGFRLALSPSGVQPVPPEAALGSNESAPRVAGKWSSNGSEFTIKQHDDVLTWTSQDSQHTYISECKWDGNSFVGTCKRTIKGTSCMIPLRLVVTPRSATEMSCEDTAMQTGCGLTQGQQHSSSWNKVR